MPHELAGDAVDEAGEPTVLSPSPYDLERSPSDLEGAPADLERFPFLPEGRSTRAASERSRISSKMSYQTERSSSGYASESCGNDIRKDLKAA